MAARGARECADVEHEQYELKLPALLEELPIQYAKTEQIVKTVVDALWEDMQAGVGDER